MRIVIGALLVVAAAAVTLSLMGRAPWCACGSLAPWSGEIWSRHNSQHLFDPYTFTHVLHGVLFYALLRPVRATTATRGAIAVVIESGWELLENTEAVIQKYREATISLDYHGDSVLNSMADIGACAVGFALAARLPVRASIAGFMLTELTLAIWIRDSLLLNILMLVWPVEAVKAWQMGG